MSTEVELKLAVAPRLASRVMVHPAVERVADAPAHTTRLLSVYYDTGRFDLWSARMSVRLRRTEAGWVQTLKWGGSVVGGLHQREELEIPVAGQTLDLDRIADPALAAALKRSRLRRRLRPVFATEFERTTRMLTLPGGSTAELCLDRGHIAAGTTRAPLCELELELKSGDASALFDMVGSLLTDCGLRPQYRSKAERGYLLAGLKLEPAKARRIDLEDSVSIAQSAVQIVASALEQMQANEEGMLAAEDPEFLHQMRVAVRRLRSCMGAYSRVLPREPFDALRAELKWLSRRLGPARDWDVFSSELLPQLRTGLSEALEPAALAGLGHAAEELRSHAHRSASTVLRSARYSRLLLALGRMAANREWWRDIPDLAAPVRSFAPGLLERRLERVLERASGRKRRTEAQLHALRIALKKLRYAVEFFASLYPQPKTRPFRRRLVRLQDCLGAISDARAMLQHIRSALPQNTQLIDTTAGWSAHVIHGQRARFQVLWRQFRSNRKFW